MINLELVLLALLPLVGWACLKWDKHLESKGYKGFFDDLDKENF